MWGDEPDVMRLAPGMPFFVLQRAFDVTRSIAAGSLASAEYTRLAFRNSFSLRIGVVTSSFRMTKLQSCARAIEFLTYPLQQSKDYRLCLNMLHQIAAPLVGIAMTGRTQK